ncbi:MAG: D-2-hydroxyacid dehydrogenase [Anaerolineaceae bacterium]
MSETIEVLITSSLTIDQIGLIEKISPRLHIQQIATHDPADISDDVWAKTMVLYTTNVLPTPEQAPNLRWIQFHWAGIDNMINAPILKRPGILATTISGAASTQIAEYVVMMMLALGHHLPDAIACQNRSEWPADRWERFHPVELRDSTVGIVGYGSIGRQIAYLLQPFGATVLAAKRNAMQTEDLGYAPVGMGDPSGNLPRRIYPGKAFRAMLKECDFIVVCVPKTKQTTNLIDEQAFAVIKPTAFLIDVSRGGIVNHTALIAAIREHKLAGAALDVFEEEPLPSDSLLWKLPGVFITPHIASNTRFYNERAVQVFITNMNRFLTGEPLLNLINLSTGY